MMAEEQVITELQIENKELRQQINEISEQLDKWSKQFRAYNKEEAQLLFRIQEVKQILLQKDISMSGYNTFGKYKYFELKDITPVIVPELLEKGLASTFFSNDNTMSLQIIDSKTGVFIQWNTKLRVISRESTPKGDMTIYMKDEQAVQTYARRTLWLQALDLVEHVPEEAQAGNNKVPEKKVTNHDEIVIPEDTDLTVKTVYAKIKKDFGTKVQFNKRTVKNKLGSMKKDGKINQDTYSKCLKILE